MILTGAKDGWMRQPKKDVKAAMETPLFISTTAVTPLTYHAPRALSMTVRVDSMTIVLSMVADVCAL